MEVGRYLRQAGKCEAAVRVYMRERERETERETEQERERERGREREGERGRERERKECILGSFAPCYEWNHSDI